MSVYFHFTGAAYFGRRRFFMPAGSRPVALAGTGTSATAAATAAGGFPLFAVADHHGDCPGQGGQY